MEIGQLKQRARSLEQAGQTAEALALYRQLLAEIEAIGALRQELPVLIKIGDLEAKTGDPAGAVARYRRAAEEYAAQGAVQPVISLCWKMLRADPGAVGAYFQLARLLLDRGFVEGARQLLLDYAARANLAKTRQGLERLAGLPEADVRERLAKAIANVEARLPRPAPRAPTPQPPPVPSPPPAGTPPAQPPAVAPARPAAAAQPTAPPPAPPEPDRRLTVPVGALDAEPRPTLLEQRPPQPQAERLAESLLPNPEDLQAPVLPDEAPPAPAPPAPASPREPPAPVAAAPPPPPAPPAPPPRAEPPMSPWAVGPFPKPPPLTEPILGPPSAAGPSDLGLEPTLVPVPEKPASEPSPRRARESRAEPDDWDARLSAAVPRPAEATAGATRTVAGTMAARRHKARAPGMPGWGWALLGVMLLAGSAAVAAWFGLLPMARLPSVLGGRGATPPPTAVRPADTLAPGAPIPGTPAGGAADSVMARDTASIETAAPAAPPPAAPSGAGGLLPALPAGVTLASAIWVVQGLKIESVVFHAAPRGQGYTIVQLLPSGDRIVLEEVPSDTAGAGEIGLGALPGDTVVGHARLAGLEVTIKGLVSEDAMVDLLQRLVEIRPAQPAPPRQH